jgi:hypothetical protein
LATFDAHTASVNGITLSVINLADRDEDASSVFVSTRDNAGAPSMRPSLMIY